MAREWKIEAKHKWVEGAVITESHNESKSTSKKCYSRFTATIRGWKNWKIFEGFVDDDIAKCVQIEVLRIREKIDSGDEEIFRKGAVK